VTVEWALFLACVLVEAGAIAVAVICAVRMTRASRVKHRLLSAERAR
jgi:hypothetical protein